MTRKLPPKVADAFAAVKKEYRFHLQIKLIRGTYCIFETKTRYDAATRKPVKATMYVGWISLDGVVVPARHHEPREPQKKKDQEKLKYIKELEEAEEDNVKRPETEKHEREILRALSMNARITVPELAKITGLKNTAVNYHLNNLERRYDIRYLLEIDIEKFGYINYIAFVKFKDKKPSYDEMKQQLEAIPHVQIAMITKGTYDMAIFLVVEADSEARGSLYDLTKGAFSSYDIEWTMTPAYFGGFGFIPLRDKFLDVLKEKIWTRTKEKPRLLPNQITETEYKMLKAMNTNADADFTEIDEEIGADRGRSNYAYHKLMKRGIIKRATISIQNLPSKFDAVFILSFINLDKFIPDRKNVLLEIIKERKYMDKYSFACDMMSPKGIMLVTHILENDNMEKTTEKLLNEVHGIKVDTLMITKTLTGLLNNRLFDKYQTGQYEILISTYKSNQELIENNILET